MRLARALVILLGVSLVMNAGTYLAAQQHQGAVLEQRLCTTLAEQAANQPPPGSADSNPSRAWEQRENEILAKLGPDVGCGGKR